MDYPARGLVYDRNGELLVYNQAAYDLMVIPRQAKAMDTAEFLKLTKFDKQEFIEKFSKAARYSSRIPSVLISDISGEDYGQFQELLFKYPGYYTQSKTLRKYPLNSASHVLGYVSEVDKNIIKKNSYYKNGDHIGRSGLEKEYEEVMR